MRGGGGGGGGGYSVSRRRYVVRIQFGKIYLNDIENGVKVTQSLSNICSMSLM